jgi:hypothetical protein
MLSKILAYCAAAALASWVAGCGSPSPDVAAATWPKKVTLEADITMTPGGDGIRLSDGARVTGQGDFNLQAAMVLRLQSPAEESFCSKDKYASLAEVPTDQNTCSAMFGESTMWRSFLHLSGSGPHTNDESPFVGMGVLVRDASHQALYRMRILGDSYENLHVTATFEYEPVR